MKKHSTVVFLFLIVFYSISFSASSQAWDRPGPSNPTPPQSSSAQLVIQQAYPYALLDKVIHHLDMDVTDVNDVKKVRPEIKFDNCYAGMDDFEVASTTQHLTVSRSCVVNAFLFVLGNKEFLNSDTKNIKNDILSYEVGNKFKNIKVSSLEKTKWLIENNEGLVSFTQSYFNPSFFIPKSENFKNELREKLEALRTDLSQYPCEENQLISKNVLTHRIDALLKILDTQKINSDKSIKKLQEAVIQTLTV